jgi:hypothetical protein
MCRRTAFGRRRRSFQGNVLAQGPERPYTVITVAVDGLERRLVATLAVYFDDSGTHSGISVAAGYVATVDDWTTFSLAWQQLLADHTDLPVNQFGLRVFHMTDFENSATDPKSVFHDWAPARKGAFMANATALINDLCGPGKGAGIVVGVVNDDFSRMVEFERFKRPYTFALLEAMKYVERWADAEGRRESILYYFDKVPKHAGETAALMEDVGRELDLSTRFRFAKWAWSSKETHSELHAADVLAYEAWKEATNERRLIAIPVRQSLRALAPCIRYYTLFDDLELRHWISAIDDAEWLEGHS